MNFVIAFSVCLSLAAIYASAVRWPVIIVVFLSIALGAIPWVIYKEIKDAQRPVKVDQGALDIETQFKKYIAEDPKV